MKVEEENRGATAAPLGKHTYRFLPPFFFPPFFAM